MPFRPNIDTELEIDGRVYRVAEHPSAHGMPYGQEGRQGVVFQLRDPDGAPAALKVFKPRFRVPGLVTGATKLAPYAAIPGLAVCARTVLTPRQHTTLLRSHIDLAYAVLMPWVIGPSWMDCVLERRALTPEQSLSLARALADLLATMEEQFVAHGDLSGPNLLLPSLATPAASPAVALVDVEQLYAPGMERPEQIVSGSSGYGHHTAAQGVWGAASDRFAGAVLLAEILGWSDSQVREASGEESYFEPEELQQVGRRYEGLLRSLERRWGQGVARLFERAWQSGTLADCPTIGEWLVALPTTLFEVADQPSAPLGTTRERGPENVMPLLALAAELRTDKNTAGALTAYRRALALLPQGDGLAMEVRLLINDLEQQDAGTGARRPLVAADHHDSTPKQDTPAPEGTRLTPEERKQIAADSRPRRRPVWPFVALLVALLMVGGSVLILQAQERDVQQAAVQTAAVQEQATEQAEQAALSLTSTQSADLTAVARQTAAAIGTSETLAMLEGTAAIRATSAALATAVAIARLEDLTATANTIASRATGEARRQTAQAEVQAQTAQAQAQIQTTQAQAQRQTAQAQAQRQTTQAEQAERTAQLAQMTAAAQPSPTAKVERTYISNFRVVADNEASITIAFDYSYDGGTGEKIVGWATAARPGPPGSNQGVSCDVASRETRQIVFSVGYGSIQTTIFCPDSLGFRPPLETTEIYIQMFGVSNGVVGGYYHGQTFSYYKKWPSQR